MNNFPAMTEAQRAELVQACRDTLRYADDYPEVEVRMARVALAALTADTSKLAELAAKVRKVREDAADFDGDRRGMWEHQEEQEQLLLEEAVKYTAPPAPVLRVPDELKVKNGSHQSHIDYAEGWADCIDEVKRLNAQPSPPEASNEQ